MEPPSNNTDESNKNSMNAGTELNEEELQAKIDTDPEVVSAFEALEAWRKYPNSRYKEKDLVKQINEARRNAEVKLGKNKKLQEELEEIKERRINIEKIISSIDDGDDENELLGKLGFLNEEGKFTFPKKYFSPLAKELYDRYIKIVDQWIQSFEVANALKKDTDEIQYLESARKSAHDQVTQQICEELHGKLDFYKVRKLVQKMRDETIPNAGESQTTAVAANEALMETAKEILAREEELTKSK